MISKESAGNRRSVYRATWTRVSMGDLRPGDLFRLRESNGDLVVDDGCATFVCTADPRPLLCLDGNPAWAVDSDRVVNQDHHGLSTEFGQPDKPT